MSTSPTQPFQHLPRSPKGHFALNLYAAVHRLVDRLRMWSDASGSSVEEVFRRHPFLEGYFAEMRQSTPRELTWSASTGWWTDAIQNWESECEAHLPLRALGESGSGLDARLALVFVGLIEEDSRFGNLFVELQQPLAHRRPTMELVQRIFARQGETEIDSTCLSLVSGGFVEVSNPQAPRSEWILRVPGEIWNMVREETATVSDGWYSLRSPDAFPAIEKLLYPKELIRRLQRLPDLLRSKKVRTLVTRGNPGVDAIELIGAVARSVGRGTLHVRSASSLEPPQSRVLGPLAVMSGAFPVLQYDLGPGETARPPRLGGYDGPSALVLGLEGGLSDEAGATALTVTLPPPPASLRRRYWQQALSSPSRELEAIADTFRVSGGYIRKLACGAEARAAVAGRRRVRVGDVRAASRELNRQLLDALAERIDARGSWSDLVTMQSTSEKLAELERRCRHRESILEHLGPAFAGDSSRGVRALLTGASGVGKTLAAKILASQLQMDLYRVDLAAVVNKYIGETEKNLHRVLSRAEALDVVLLLDEGDALLGHRTEVKSANDRYANLETNYLLQKLENYQGILLVTTNFAFADNIDPAFHRRMDVVVRFLAPQAEERWQIFQLHLPADHTIEAGLLETIALRCALTGGQIRNVVHHATLLALDDVGPLASMHLEHALRSEYRKAGATYPLALPPSRSEELDGGTEAFIAALADQ